jgi:PleD family two-component response regulator
MVLFNPELPDSRGIATFTALHDTAKNTPLVALLERTDEGLGRRMLRHGAQDFLIKEDVDCRPLARTMLNAIERQRFLRGTRIASAIDLETGFYHEDGFRSAAERDLQLATECDRSLALVLAELDNLRDVDAASGREAAHEMVVEAANVIRAGVRDTALVGRSSLGRFEMLSWQNNVDEIISNLQGQVQAGQHTFAFVFGYAAMRPGSGATLDDLIRDAQAVLDANKQSYPSLT